MQDSTKNMSLVALSNRYKEAISLSEGAVAEALNEIQFCDDNKGLVKRRRVGRPVLPIASIVGTPSILTFLSAIKGVE